MHPSIQDLTEQKNRQEVSGPRPQEWESDPEYPQRKWCNDFSISEPRMQKPGHPAWIPKKGFR
jgi:hypothetical protein